ncbi:MAG: c-type cytochrome [Gammaproteobacteria bacterium]|nr:c-type cytochrome [Gammaproteobacteria bacterium]MCW8958988.1 c-type cytochrome [Gammaproteobacteria bacterium]MCW8972640.1 c-type cytochrome [Gammaproteobacteria bacterium]MCW8992033.1 c-type cytochrome [Gammaproteobacteria bacterium]
MFRSTLFLISGLLLSTTLLAAPDGARLYERHCSACHGLEGEGGVGVPLVLPSFQRAVEDDFLFTTIRHGRPGRVMPAFTSLSDAQVRAIVDHLRSWAPERPQQAARPVRKPAHGKPGRGKALFAQHCAQCHGANGEGGHGTGVTFSRPRDLPVMAPALNNPGFLAAADDHMIKRTLMEGREGTPMVSFLDAGLNEQQIDDIVSYVRSFEEEPLHWQYDRDEAPAITMESSYDLQTTVENIKRAAVGKNFRIIRIQRLEDGLFEEGEQNEKQVIVYFCNFNFINEALSLDPRVGLFMPCRITAVEKADGTVELMAINPRYMSRLFNNAELDEACTRMHNLYESIIEEATL